jgi:hypothetical protein
MHKLLLALALVSLILPTLAEGRGGGHSGGASYSASGHTSGYSGSHSSTYCASCARDSEGRIARSSDAREEFMRATGYPHGRPGYVIDHVIPLKRGGPDSPSNMQWQTKADAKAKDRWE